MDGNKGDTISRAALLAEVDKTIELMDAARDTHAMTAAKIIRRKIETAPGVGLPEKKEPVLLDSELWEG